MIKNIIFDWSGVICDNTKNVYLTAMLIFKKFGVKKISFQKFKKDFKLPLMLFYNKYIPDLTLKEEQKLYAKEYTNFKKPSSYKNINKIIKDLKKAGTQMAIISSDPPVQLKKEIKDFDLENVFLDVKSWTHDKSHALKQIIKKYNFELSETIFIADTAHEIEIGNKMNIKTGAVSWGINDLDKLIKAKPSYLIKKPEQINKLVYDS